MGSHYLLPVYLVGVSVVDLLIGCGSRPRTTAHLICCFPAAFLFPGPLLLPPRAKTACTSSSTHFAVRAAETFALMLVAGWCSGFDIQETEDLLGRELSLA